jgi:hypothetical protein
VRKPIYLGDGALDVFCGEDCGAEDAPVGGIGDYLDEALVLPYFARLALRQTAAFEVNYLLIGDES